MRHPLGPVRGQAPNPTRYPVVWVLFTASGGTPAILTSLNVSSLTDNGVGDFTVNHVTLRSANTAVMTAGRYDAGAAGAVVWLQAAPGASSVRVGCVDIGTDTGKDLEAVSVSIFGRA